MTDKRLILESEERTAADIAAVTAIALGLLHTTFTLMADKTPLWLENVLPLIDAAVAVLENVDVEHPAIGRIWQAKRALTDSGIYEDARIELENAMLLLAPTGTVS
jgi:hypothetical protein